MRRSITRLGRGFLSAVSPGECQGNQAKLLTALLNRLSHRRGVAAYQLSDRRLNYFSKKCYTVFLEESNPIGCAAVKLRRDPLSSEQRSERMSRVRGKNTKPELWVRRIVWSLGFRYRLHSARLPGRPDIVFTRLKKVIFIHGCFWHQHQGCRHYRMPQSRLGFWLPKLEGNAERDRLNQKALRKLGWSYLVIWECQLRDTLSVAKRINGFLNEKPKIS